MTSVPDKVALDQLLEAARRQALARFEKDVEAGKLDPAAEITKYRRQQRDYRTLLRMNRIPDEARGLASRLLQTHELALTAAMRQEFERDVTQLLIRLYDEFIAHSSNPPQGSK